ncbi:MAG: DUF5777 family beta-barrel protein [Chitinophagaceae bacterium]
MRSLIALAACCIMLQGIAQDTTVVSAMSAPLQQKQAEPAHIFYSPRLINMTTVQALRKGVLEFRVVHNFGDAGGDLGGIKNFFGLDNAADVRIGFWYGLSDRVNIAAARYKGSGPVQQLYELALKYVVLQQAENDLRKPLSLALFANQVVSGMKAGTNPESENAFGDEFSNRLSNVVQLMIARKFGKRLSLQLSPSYVHRNFVLPYDEKSLFALGAALRLHLGGRYSLLVDYAHTFRGQGVIDSFAARNIHFRDVLGVGLEILTGGHVFHLNFTNATDILENRFLARTVTSWGKGQFRWGFTVSRDFDLLWKKRNKK